MTFIIGEGKEGNPAVYRNGNDIVILTNFVDENNSQKLVTTTIKDYFKEGNVGAGNVTVDGVPCATDPANITSFFREVVKDKKYYDTVDGTGSALINLSGSNVYTLNHTGNKSKAIWDVKGSDTYILSDPNGANGDTIVDFAGSDKYTLKNGAKARVTDYKGNDKYTIEDSNGSEFNIGDYAGNDTYDFTRGSNINITDYKGNDKYIFDNLVSFNITENGGNDRYTLSNISAESPYNTITDKGGNDAYEMTNVTAKVQIRESKGNDKYTLKNVTTTITEYMITDLDGNDKYSFDSVYRNSASGDGYKVFDAKGNDKYEFKGQNDGVGLQITDGVNTISGNDTYTFDSTNKVVVYDKGGNNKYTVKNSDNITIFSNAQSVAEGKYNDTYTISGTKGKKGAADTYSTNIRIYDDAGSDKFNLSYTQNAQIRIESSSEKDKNVLNISNSEDFFVSSSYSTNIASNETYNIKSSSGMITDSKGDDTYKVDKLNNQLTIWDIDGTDSLTISKSKANDLVFMADNKSFDLYIYDKTNCGYAVLKNYFTGTVNDSVYTFTEGNGDGYIETIKAGSKNVNNLIGDYNYFNQQIAAWETETYGAMDVANVLQGNNAEALNALVQLFTPQA